MTDNHRDKSMKELVEDIDIEWDEEKLKSLHLSKEEAMNLYKNFGYDYRGLEYIGEFDW